MNISSLGNIINGISVGGDAISNMKEGKGVVKSVAKAGIDYVIQDAVFAALGGPAGLALMGTQFAKIGLDLTLALGKQNVENTKANITGIGKVGGYKYNDNEYSATMRQRSLDAIGGSQGITRNALGNEARKRASTISY